MVFSVIIPLIAIPVKSTFTLNNSFDRFNMTLGHIIKGKATNINSSPLFTLQNISLALLLIITSILLIRFILNIVSLIRKINESKKVDYLKTSLVLLEENTLPYSFFRYVFVNRSDFENGKIDKDLLIHEEAHCLQYHSIDILIIELLNVFFWFNPAIWLYRKAILLNHEYYADDKVLTYSDPIDYHQLLLNIFVKNNSSYLVSNFKYSLIKHRLIMMARSGPSHNAILRKIAAISLFLFLGMAFTFSQDTKITMNSVDSIELPQFPGGDYGSMTWINNNLKYPAEAFKANITGKLEVNFVVNSKGKVTNVKVNKPVHPLLDAEAIRVISSMPDWKPGRKFGRLADVEMKIPITFMIR